MTDRKKFIYDVIVGSQDIPYQEVSVEVIKVAFIYSQFMLTDSYIPYALKNLKKKGLIISTRRGVWKALSPVEMVNHTS